MERAILEIEEVLDSTVCEGMGVGKESGCLFFDMRPSNFWRDLRDALKDAKENGMEVEISIKLDTGNGNRVDKFAGYIGMVEKNRFSLHRRRPS